MSEFRIVRDLTASLFKECAVWSEYYDFEELEEIRSWGVEEKHINELLEIAKEGASHPYYPVRDLKNLPDRMRIFISAKFISPSGVEFEGVVCNPNPFVIGIFVGDEIEVFNPNLTDFWVASEAKVKAAYGIGNEPIFPLRYSTKYKDAGGNLVEGVYGSKSNA